MDNVTFSHHTAPVNGIQMHYVIGGQDDPVFLLHGWPQIWYDWRHIMPTLAKNYTIIAPDLRGLGHISFHQVPDLPEFLVEDKERDYLSIFFKIWA